MQQAIILNKRLLDLSSEVLWFRTNCNMNLQIKSL